MYYTHHSYSTYYTVLSTFTIPTLLSTEQAVASRQTCLNDEGECVKTALKGALEFQWLRSSNAPSWVKLPESAAGFRISSNRTEFSTSWVANALVDAGRAYQDLGVDNNASHKVIAIRHASLSRKWEVCSRK